MPQVKEGLRGHEVPAEPGTYQKIPLPIMEPDAAQRAVLRGQRKKYSFKSRSVNFIILLESTLPHVVDGRLYDGKTMQIHFHSDGGTPAFGVYQTDDEKENELLRKAKSFGSDFWDADERELRDQAQAIDRLVGMFDKRPDLVKALLRRLGVDPAAKDFSAVLRPDQTTEPTFKS